ncbi:Uncharacterised protein [Mycobacteroides abscessus subsp. abscessus]|nr:Uncharacterised protein [Mycobacteroides abscessus subsp. abscessus]
MGDFDGLGRSGRAGRQLHEGDGVLIGLEGFDRVGVPQILDVHDDDALLLQNRSGGVERSGHDDGLGADHVDDLEGVLGPYGEVGTRGRLVQHCQRGTAHPHGLDRRSDLHGHADQHADGIVRAKPSSSESTRNLLGALVDLLPGMPDRSIGFAGDHALAA